jgi:hypothetical protein
MNEHARQPGNNTRSWRSRPPRLFTMIIAAGKSDCTRDWMMRHSVTQSDVEGAAWRTFRFAILLAFGLMASLFLVFGGRTMVYTLLPAVLVPLLFANRVANSPSRQAKKEQRAYLRESPGTIGTLVMNMRIQPSFEWAMGRVSHTCSGELTKRFVRMGWEVLTRRSDSLEQALLAFIPRLSGQNDAVGRSLHLVLASTYEPDVFESQLSTQASDVSQGYQLWGVTEYNNQDSSARYRYERIFYVYTHLWNSDGCAEYDIYSIAVFIIGACG